MLQQTMTLLHRALSLAPNNADYVTEVGGFVLRWVWRWVCTEVGMYLCTEVGKYGGGYVLRWV